MKWLIPAAAALTLAAATFMARRVNAAAVDPTYYADDPNTMPDLLNDAQNVAAEAVAAVTGSPADWYRTSDAMKARLMVREGCRLPRYRLGDGGYTLGYGRYFADGGTVPPASIDQATADAWFDEDLIARGEKWVKLYISVPISQNQFDALTSMAYNLRPSSFKNIADAVNAGQNPTPVAMQYTRPGTNLERGLIARREDELGIFNGTIQA